MPYLDLKSLKLERRERRLTVRSPFWSVTHDLDRGGTPVDIRFVHGIPGNILREPMATFVDGRSDAEDSKATFERTIFRMVSRHASPDGSQPPCIATRRIGFGERCT